MREITTGSVKLRLVAARRDGDWMAHAERVDTSDPFGIDCSGPTEAAALDRLAEWLTWQHEHSAALDALQQAERAYHRAVAGSAFGNPSEGFTAVELQQESLDQVDAARVRLDEVRAQKPE